MWSMKIVISAKPRQKSTALGWRAMSRSAGYSAIVAAYPAESRRRGPTVCAAAGNGRGCDGPSFGFGRLKRYDLGLKRLMLRLASQAAHFLANVLEHVDANRRRQIGIGALAIDAAQEIGYGDLFGLRNGPHFVPERLLETDAGFVPADHDRALGDCGFSDLLH